MSMFVVEREGGWKDKEQCTWVPWQAEEEMGCKFPEMVKQCPTGEAKSEGLPRILRGADK